MSGSGGVMGVVAGGVIFALVELEGPPLNADPLPIGAADVWIGACGVGAF